MAWLSGYGYRKQVVITGQTGAGTLYQVLLKVGESSGSTGADFHIEDHDLAWPDDIRFTDDDGTTLLDYWLEKTEGAAPNRLAHIWVKVADDLGSNQNIYCYYNKSGDTSASNGANTFIQFHGAATAAFKDANIVPPNNVAFGAKVKATASSHNLLWGLNKVTGDTDDYFLLQSHTASNARYGYARNGANRTQISEAPSFTLDTWYRIRFNRVTSAAHYFVDDDEIATGITTNFPDENLGLQYWPAVGTGEQEFSFARKYVSSEPAFSSAGAEETRAAVGRSFGYILG